MDETCTSLKEDQLYIIELVVHHVILRADKTDKLDLRCLKIDLQLVNLPLITMGQTEFPTTRAEKIKSVSLESKQRTIKFNTGEVYLFAENPNRLINSLRLSPLEVCVYKTKVTTKCGEDTFGNARIPLPGCLCDQVTMAANDVHHRPNSYSFSNTYALIDKNSNLAGYVALSFKLTCFGKYIGMQYAIFDNTLIFKHDGNLSKSHCTLLTQANEAERKAMERERKLCKLKDKNNESEIITHPRPENVVSLILTCRELFPKDFSPQTPNWYKKALDKKATLEVLEEKVEKDFRYLNFNTETSYRPVRRTYITVEENPKPYGAIACTGGLCLGPKLLNRTQKNF